MYCTFPENIPTPSSQGRFFVLLTCNDLAKKANTQHEGMQIDHFVARGEKKTCARTMLH